MSIELEIKTDWFPKVTSPCSEDLADHLWKKCGFNFKSVKRDLLFLKGERFKLLVVIEMKNCGSEGIV